MRLILAVAAVCFLSLPLGAAEDWPVAKYAPAIFPIYSESQQCTAVLVARNGVYLTANHCLGETAEIRGVAVTVLARSAPDDLAVVMAPVFSAPLRVARQAPDAGDDILQLGFGMDSSNVMPIPSTWIGPVGRDGGPPILHAAGGIQGMSGGPILNRRGEIVGLIKGTYAVKNHNVSDVVQLGPIQEAVKQWAK